MPPRNILGIRSGTAINRQYKNTRIGVYVKASCAVAWFGGGAVFARQKNAPMAILGGLMSCSYIKETSQFLKKLSTLRPDYQEVVNRAKQIYRATSKKV